MDDDRLKGWKEVADFLHVGERTAQRWEHTLGLPVHRIETARSAIVFASCREVNAWLQTAEGRKARSEELTAESPVSDGHSSGSPEEGASSRLAHHVLSTPSISEPIDSEPPRPPVPVANLALHEPSRVLGVRRGMHLHSLLLTGGLVLVVGLGSVLLYDRVSGKLSSTTGHPPTRLAPTPPAKNSPILPAGQTTHRAVALRLTLADGRTLRVTQNVGSLATVSLTGHPSYILSAEATDDGVRIHVFRVQSPAANGSQHLEELAVVRLKPGDKKELRAPADITAIEWCAPSAPRQPQS